MRRILLLAVLLYCFVVINAHAATPPPSFDTALYQIVLPVEGWYVNDPHDTGGETCRGISRKNFPRWSGWVAIDAIKRTVPPQPKFGTDAYYAWVRPLNAKLKASAAVKSAVENFYRGYWVALHMGECRYADTAYFWADTLTNNGPIANRWLKKAINRTAHRQVVNDKTITITAQTVHELNKLPQDRVLFWFAVQRGAKYDAIADRNGQYTDSWADRFIARILAMAKGAP